MATTSVPRPASGAVAAATGALLALGARTGGAELAACRFERWPFDAWLPRLERDRVILPADAIGARSLRAWRPEDGVELPVRAGGLQIGRFVLVLRRPGTGLALAPGVRGRALDIADECGAAIGAVLAEGATPWPT